ncbi:MAG: cyclic nucleotide-binding domain-containing protein [Deltaproteobacteria bacterium]|nr:cyclic nucleotide-binding domain-containing protein [Deltaproteobacteria bacterium]
MALTPEQIQSIPLFANIHCGRLDPLCTLFEQQSIQGGEVLFSAGDRADALYVLTAGEISLREGDQVRLKLVPPAAIGELGSITGITRFTTAVATQPSEVWRVTSEQLASYFDQHGDVAYAFYRSLMQIVADKVHRDQLRLEDMRGNIIRTQKAMKSMRDLVLESAETPISEKLHGTLEQLIAHNRRVNYRVRPHATLPASVRLDDGRVVEVIELSRTHVVLPAEARTGVKASGGWSGVFRAAGHGEWPISGTVVEIDDGCCEVELDLMIDEYGRHFDEYLTRLQILDFVV